MTEHLAPSETSNTALTHSWPWPPSQMSGRLLDVIVALLALALLGPLMVFLALAVALQGDGPVLFRHTRVGKGGVAFQVLKFRSMAVDGDRILAEHLRDNPQAAAEWACDHKLKNDPRVGALGALLRTSSLDELPQLFNVLRGEMSIVGPRPIVQAEVLRYGRAFASYSTVRPGITGLWQVSGRNNISYRRRIAMDAVYSRRKNVMLDLRLMLATVPAVLARRGSY